MTTCWNSSATFMCSINETKSIQWYINGKDPLFYNLSSPEISPIINGPGRKSNLTIPGSYQFNGASIVCYYSPPTMYSMPAVLRVQGVIAIIVCLVLMALTISLGYPLNLKATFINCDSVYLSWNTSMGEQVVSSFSFLVQIWNTRGLLVHNITLQERQVVFNRIDPCNQYTATVLPLCHSAVPMSTEEIAIPGGKIQIISIHN